MKQAIFETEGNILSYSIGGDLNKPTVVLLPPGIGDSKYFQALCEELESRFCVFTVDFPGVGTSHFTHTNTIRGIASALGKLLTTLNIQNPIVVGASYGGSTRHN